MTNTPLISARHLSRRWGTGPTAQFGVADVDLSIGHGELVAVIGPSGSGKSTLGALLAGIDQPTSGSLVIDGRRIDGLRNAALARWRSVNVGIVFQNFHLLPTLTAAENVELALTFGPESIGRRERRDRSRDALADVGLAEKRTRLPSELSGGEQQRVAIARAVVTRPPLIVADEPTGALDQAASGVVVELLTTAARAGTTVVLITHDPTIAAGADRVVEMLDGRLHRHTAAGVDLMPMTASFDPHPPGEPLAPPDTSPVSEIRRPASVELLTEAPVR